MSVPTDKSRRLKSFCSNMTDGELESIAANASLLTDQARAVLQAELRRRRLVSSFSSNPRTRKPLQKSSTSQFPKTLMLMASGLITPPSVQNVPLLTSVSRNSTSRSHTPSRFEMNKSMRTTLSSARWHSMPAESRLRWGPRRFARRAGSRCSGRGNLCGVGYAGISRLCRICGSHLYPERDLHGNHSPRGCAPPGLPILGPDSALHHCSAPGGANSARSTR
jgi:hypothetical protein